MFRFEDYCLYSNKDLLASGFIVVNQACIPFITVMSAFHLSGRTASHLVHSCLNVTLVGEHVAKHEKLLRQSLLHYCHGYLLPRQSRASQPIELPCWLPSYIAMFSCELQCCKNCSRAAESTYYWYTVLDVVCSVCIQGDMASWPNARNNYACLYTNLVQWFE